MRTARRLEAALVVNLAPGPTLDLYAGRLLLQQIHAIGAALGGHLDLIDALMWLALTVRDYDGLGSVYVGPVHDGPLVVNRVGEHHFTPRGAQAVTSKRCGQFAIANAEVADDDSDPAIVTSVVCFTAEEAPLLLNGEVVVRSGDILVIDAAEWLTQRPRS